MDQEYKVLDHLQENEITTERKTYSRIGLSDGAVNFLLKKWSARG